MKKVLFIVCATLSATCLSVAQNNATDNDSITFSTALNELAVEADRVINKVDKQLILPTQAQKKASTNGIMLLQQLQIPGLAVNPLDKSITSNFGDNVQLRINGAEATKEEITAIRPKDVVRIEYHANPGLRYGNVAAVVNYIVKTNKSGGNIAGDFTNGIKPLGFGEYNLSARYNYNLSSISAVASWERRDLKWNRENEETFHYPENSITNEETGFPTTLKYDYMNLTMSYNHIDGNKNMLNVALRNKYDNIPYSFYDRNSVLTQNGIKYSILDRNKSKSYIPSLDIYYQLNLKDDQHLYLDVVGTYINSRNSRIFSMTEDACDPDMIYSETEGDKYSIIGEAIYERNLFKGKLTTGAKHQQSYINNVYDGNINSKVKMNTAETYIFGEYQSAFKKLNYTFGLGIMRTYYKQEQSKQENYTLRPTLTVSYQPARSVFLKYNAYMSSYAPSLSDLSDVTQEMDIYQVKRGNPDLKSVRYFTNSLTASWRNKLVNIELSGRYSYDDSPIMEETLYENGKFVRTYANQKGFHRINLQTSIQIYPYKEHLAICLSPYFNRYISLGNAYKHTHSNAGFKGSLIGMYKNWAIMAEMSTSYHTLWGETIS